MADTGHSRDYASTALEFAREAAADKKGKRHCKWVRLAAKRHLDDLERAASEDCPFKFDDWHANDVCDFAEKMPHVEGVWDTPTITLEPPQIFILCVVFGYRRKADGLRRFSDVYIEMARKGAKSTLTAVVSLYCLTCEGEVGPQVLVGATTGDQAKKVFGPAWMMVAKTEPLRDAFDLKVWGSPALPRSITCDQNGGYIQPLNAKASTQDGHNPHVGVLDELHAHKDRGLHDVIKSAFGARKNPLMWRITTAGYNVEGVCYEQRTMVTKILEGLIEADHYFGIVFTLDEGDDEYDETKWVKANPMLGVTPTLASMQSYAQEAKASPDSAGEFKTKRLNIWTTARNAWLNMEHWKRCNGPVDPEQMYSRPCLAGMDLASVSDITALMLVWIDDDDIYVKGHYYLPEAAVEPRTKKGNVPYMRWRDAGYLTVTPGNVTDYNWMRRDIDRYLESLDIRGFGFDPWNSSQIVSDLMEDGAPMVQVRQGFQSLNQPMARLEKAVQGHRLHHGGDPVLAWMASNVVARRDANNNMAPDKKHSMEKIDGIVALLNALHLENAELPSGDVVDYQGLAVA